MSNDTISKIIPPKLAFLIYQMKIKYLKRYAEKSYAQEGEDMVLKRIFAHKKNGFFVDVGAHHPKRFSNTYFLYKKGWRGINIDARPGSMKAFNNSRPLDINIEIPISDKKEVLTYYCFKDSAFNGFSKALSLERANPSNPIISEIQIETATLEEVLSNNMPDNTEIDLLTIDVEGFDFKVLKSTNLTLYKPKVILVEVFRSKLKEVENDPITVFLKQFNYSIISKLFNSVLFMNDSYYDETFGKGTLDNVKK